MQRLRAMTDANWTTDWMIHIRNCSICAFSESTGKLTNTARVNVVRKEIARIKTMLRERELADDAE